MEITTHEVSKSPSKRKQNKSKKIGGEKHQINVATHTSLFEDQAKKFLQKLSLHESKKEAKKNILSHS